jgi:hypothetical protein
MGRAHVGWRALQLQAAALANQQKDREVDHMRELLMQVVVVVVVMLVIMVAAPPLKCLWLFPQRNQRIALLSSLSASAGAAPEGTAADSAAAADSSAADSALPPSSLTAQELMVLPLATNTNPTNPSLFATFLFYTNPPTLPFPLPHSHLMFTSPITPSTPSTFRST